MPSQPPTNPAVPPPRRSAVIHPATYAVVAALCVRAAFLMASHHAEDGRLVALTVVGREAQLVASSLASGKGFSNAFTGYDMPTAWLAPVYAWLLSLGFRAFPINITDGGLYIGQLMNIAFSAFTCWPICWLGTRLAGRRVGLAAAWTWAAMPLAILYPLEWVWDQSLSAFVLALLLCATHQIREAQTASPAWAGYGCLWGFAALVNPTLCVLLPFLLAWIALGRLRTNAAVLAPLGKCVLLFVLCLLPWTVRNYFTLDGFVFVKSNFGLELWLGNNTQVPADDVFSPTLHPMENFRELLPLVFQGEPQYMRVKERQALDFMRTHPQAFADLVGRRVLDTWTASNDSRHDPWITLLRLGPPEVWFTTVFSLVAFAGLFLALWRDPDQAMPLALAAIVFPIPYYVTHSSLRYRHPIDPVLTVLAVYAVSVVVYARSASASAVDSREAVSPR